MPKWHWLGFLMTRLPRLDLRHPRRDYERSSLIWSRD